MYLKSTYFLKRKSLKMLMKSAIIKTASPSHLGELILVSTRWFWNFSLLISFHPQCSFLRV